MILIDVTVDFVKRTLEDAEGGHDWWHIFRVWKVAKQIALQEEGVDVLVVELAALLHDIADPKFHDGNEELGPQVAVQFLAEKGLDSERVFHVEQIIRNMSFKSSLGELSFRSAEMDIVQDADRLDAIGAIGIARAFSFGGFKNRPLYDPAVPPNLSMSKEEYKKSKSHTINHFYEKLLLLKDKMNTPTAKKIAASRHVFMEQYLAQFYAEWDADLDGIL